MKKLIVILSLLLLLTGCGGKVIYGEVQSVTPKGQYTELTIVGKEDIVLADSETLVYNFMDMEEQLLSGELIRPYITAYDLKRTSGGYYSKRIYMESVQLPDGYVLSDGSVLTVRKDHTHTSYSAADGTEILREQVPFGPHNVSVGGLPTFDMLSPQAQEAILSHYEEQGILYDLDAELERAWERYQISENQSMFSGCLVSQEVSPTAANDTLIWYAVHVTLPTDGGLHHQTSHCTVFNRETGAVVDPADLFLCSEAEAARIIVDAAGVQDPQLRREMEQAFQFDYLNFTGYALDVCFPAGSLVHENGDHYLGIKYEDLSHILQDWAIPERDS